MTDRELMQQALETLELVRSSHNVMLLSDPPQDAWKTRGVDFKILQAITALRAALVTPPRREWLSLTDDERLEVAGIDGADEWFWKVVEALEAKLKEKNT